MHDPGHNVRLRSSAITSVGQVRENNQDSVAVWTGKRAVVAVVADGMGGAAAGEEASRIAVETVAAELALAEGTNAIESMTTDSLKTSLRQSILNANLHIIEVAIENPEMRGMGTTITLACVRGREVTVAHVGDSRAYQVSPLDKGILQITSDHSFVEALLSAGHITPEQAEEHPMRNVLYRALGQTEEVDVDIYRRTLQMGDRLVLCSDGLTRHVKPYEIAKYVLNEDDPAIAGQRLVDLANARGGEDNVSVIVITTELDGTALPHLAHESDTLDDTEDDTLVISGGSTREIPVDEEPTWKNNIEHREKMDAERISDSAEGSDCKHTNKDPDAAPPSHVMEHKNDPTLPAQNHEGEGEGRDTLRPDQ